MWTYNSFPSTVLTFEIFLIRQGWTPAARRVHRGGMKRLVVGMLCVALVQVATAQDTVREAVVKIDKGSSVEVRLKAKEKVRGRLGDVSDNGFTVQVVKNGTVTSRDIAFADVTALKRTGKPGKGGYVAMALGFAAVGAGVVIAIAAWQFAHWH